MAATLQQFLNALSGQESGGDYSVSNRTGSGAHGKYQFMPQYWPEFASAAGLSPNAEMTPANQERVAQHRAQSLFDQYGNWEDVASVWYSGRPISRMDPGAATASQNGGPSIQDYVSQVMGRVGGSAQPQNGRAPAAQRVSWAGAPITQGFGPTSEKLDGGYGGYANFNKGYDYGIPSGTPIDATTGGVVIAAGDSGDGWGISVKVQDANGYIHNYGHLSGANVEVGDTVGRGQFVGASGNTGKSTGPHLSYDVADPSGNWVDPERWVNGGGNMADMLPFSEQDYLSKYTRYGTLGYQIQNPQTDALGNPLPVDPALLEEYYKLGYELSEYDRIKSEGGTGLKDDLARLDYNNKNNPALIDAENSANAWARQQKINSDATSGTAQAMSEQRQTQNAAAAETAAYKGSSQFTAPMGFRVGSTDLPTEDEVFASQLEKASRNLPEVKPIPYSGAFPTAGGPRPYSMPPGQDFGTPATREDFASARLDFQGQSTGTPATRNDFNAAREQFKPQSSLFQAPQGPINPGPWQGPINTYPNETPAPIEDPGHWNPLDALNNAAKPLVKNTRRFAGSLFGR